ncbi:MAG: hypothetical protein KGZ68_04390 [Dechloromonas sp.]|nr:hypothetical protein [Dechloromonas sp.]
MAQLSALYPLVRPWVPGVPDIALDLVGRQVVRDFSRKTRAVLLTLDPITLTAGTSTVTLTPPSGYEIVSPVSVRYNGRVLTPKAADALDAATPFEDWRTLAPGTPAVFVSDSLEPNVITVYPANGEDAVLSVRAAVAQAGAFTVIPDILMRWERVLAAGMKAELFRMPDTTYFKPDLLPIEEARYADGWASARFDVLRGGVDAPAHVSMIPLA